MSAEGAATVRSGISYTTAVVVLIAAIAIAAGFALRIAIASVDVATLAWRVLPDDAFYYFETADRIGRGQNVSFDGIHVSNGYHPLWLFILVPVFLLPGDTLPVHAALAIAALLDVGAAVVTGVAVWRLTGKAVAGLLALTVYLFIPQNVFSAMNGVESSLAAAFLALLMLFVVEANRAPVRTVKHAAAIGLVGGLMMLSRLDSAPVFAAALVLLVWPLRTPSPWRCVLTAGVVAAAIVAPWFIWSAIALGTLEPVSAVSPTWILRAIYDAGHPGADGWDHLRYGLHLTRDLIEVRIPALYFPSRRYSTAFLALLVCLAAHLLLFSRGEERRRYARSLMLVALPIVAFGLTLFVNSAYRWNVREWYFAWAMPLGMMLAGIAFGYMDDLVASALKRMHAVSVRGELLRPFLLYAALATLFAFAFVTNGRDRWEFGRYGFQRDGLAVAEYANANIGPDERIASFNAGVIGYFTDAPVVNIDGVVNKSAYDALRDRRMLAYLREENVRYTADYYGAWTWLPGFIVTDGDWSKSLWGEDPALGFRLVADVGIPGFFGQMRIYEVLPEPSAESQADGGLQPGTFTVEERQ